MDDSETRIEVKKAHTFKEELVLVTKSILSNKSKDKICLLAHYGWDRDQHVTLQEIADNGPWYGFDRNVTRERVRQKVKNADVRIRRSQNRVRFHKWIPAVEQAIKNSIMPESEFVSLFGFNESKPGKSFNALQKVADIFDLGFPFNAYDDKGQWIIYDETVGALSTIKEKILRSATATPYATLREVKEEINCPQAILITIIESSKHLEFLDDEKRFYWKRPALPPKDYGKTCNNVLTVLCKIFSVANKSSITDLQKSLRKSRLLRLNIPAPVIQGIARHSGLFEVNGDVISRKPKYRWLALTPRDIDLLKVACEYGKRILSTKQLHASLLAKRFSPIHARAIVHSSPFLIQTIRGMWAKEGLYKFIPTLDEINTSILKYSNQKSNVGTPDDQECRNSYNEKNVISLPINSRVLMSGKFVQDKQFEYMGTWSIVNGNGIRFGEVHIEGHVMSGLKPIINALGLKQGDQIKIRVESIEKRIFHLLS